MKEAIVFLGVLAALVTFLVMGSGDDRAQITWNDPALRDHPPTCLSLQVHPENAAIEKALRDQYTFSEPMACPYRLEVSWKSNIHCTSNQNSDRKALSAFPSSFLRMEIRRGMRLLYTYYIDLPRPAGAEDAVGALKRVRKDLGFH
jgi:hypothetical protein